MARTLGGRWLVRIEDLDPPREIAGAADRILRTLERYGLHWDADVVYQSHRGALYTAALEQLRNQGLAYPCTCSRREVARLGRPGAFGPIYPGTCRTAHHRSSATGAVRVMAPDCGLEVRDRVQGPYAHNLARETGDFIVRRGDGLISYQLAVVVDDADQGVTQVVRGADLLGSTPRQVLLQEYLGLPTPDYAHLPLVAHARGEKLSKQTGASALPWDDPRPALLTALCLLGQRPPSELLEATVDELWTWALTHWRLAAIPSTPTVPAPPSLDRSAVQDWITARRSGT